MKSLISLLTTIALLSFPVYAQTGLTSGTWTNLTQGDSIVILQKEGISTRVADTTSTVTNAQLVGPTAAKSGSRLRGSITPTVTDTYTFWVSGKDNVALWISDDASRFNKKLVAYNLTSTTATEWDKHIDQKSIPIQLTAGQSYYLEAQMMDKSGGGHLAVAWRGQSGNFCLAANGGVASQSTTTTNSADVSCAIDSYISGVDGVANYTLTKNVTNSWLQVDFSQDRSINQVVLYNRPSSQNRLSNFRISVLDVNNVELVGQNFFTNSGNVGNSMTWSLPSTVTGARKVKVQLLGNNLAGNGYLSIEEIKAYGVGLVAGRIDQREVIPAAYLNTLAADADDTNNNNLSDTWETKTGLASSVLPGALLEYGDPDMDGLSNYQEQSLGSDPLSKDTLTNGLTRFMWMDFTGAGMAALTNSKNFYSYPNSVMHVPGVDYVYSQSQIRFAARYRGSVIAPVTGDYRFWISSNSQGSELWFSDGSVKDPATQNSLTNRFGKQRIAFSGYGTPLHDFDYSPTQRSAVIHLVQGQEYYIEAIQAHHYRADHISVAWQVPGQQRDIIPASAFLSDNPEDSDADNDNLPDAWEITYGLSSTDNGYIDLKEGEFGDSDGDSLTNLQEYQLGTNPKNTDSDGDSISDSEEVNIYGSNPLVSNNLAPVTIYTPSLNQYTTATGSWSSNSDGSLSAQYRRGGISYTFTVTQPGVHEVSIAAGALSNKPNSTHLLAVKLTLDDETSPFAEDLLSSKYSRSDTMKAITPWLEAGTHTLTIFHENYNASLRIRLDSVHIKRLGGADLNEDGIPDWVGTNAALANTLTHVPTTSRTSPVSIEGITQQLSSVSLTALAPGATEASALTLTRSINDSFFADVPLSKDGAVTLDASLMKGLVTESYDITWIATNLFDSFTDNTLHIRKGDALLLDAWSGTAADGMPFTVTLNGSLLADENQNTTHTSGVPFAATFATAGTYTLVATHDGQTATVTVKVHAANFGASHIVLVNNTRSWTPTLLDTTALIEADENLVFNETTANPQTGPRSFVVKAEVPVNRYVIARLPSGLDGAPSAILARGTVHAFDVALAGQTGDSHVVTRYADGTWLMSNTYVAVNLPPGIMIQNTIKVQGTLYTNGSDTIQLRAEDFDQNGIATVYYEGSESILATKLCHNTKIFIEE